MGKPPVRVVTEQEEVAVPLDVGPAVETEAAPVPAEAPGHLWLTYRGSADALRYLSYTLKPGVPVEVPKDIAEALLVTNPREFKVSTEPPSPPPVEE